MANPRTVLGMGPSWRGGQCGFDTMARTLNTRADAGADQRSTEQEEGEVGSRKHHRSSI